MTVKGKIKNVVDFGAFVDLGIKETALLHISEMSDSFVANPLDAVKVGDIVECKIIALDEARRRISLSRKTASAPQGTAAKQQEAGKDSVKKVKVKTGHTRTVGAAAGTYEKQQKAHAARDGRPTARDRRNDDGTTYNPFAAFFNKK